MAPRGHKSFDDLMKMSKNIKENVRKVHSSRARGWNYRRLDRRRGKGCVLSDDEELKGFGFLYGGKFDLV